MINESDMAKAFDKLHLASQDRTWINARLGKLVDPTGYALRVDGTKNSFYVSLGRNGDQGVTTAIDMVGVAEINWQEIRLRREDNRLVIREASAYAAGGGGGATNLNALTDVTLASPANGQTLQYNSSSGQWVNVVPPGGAGGAPSPHDLAVSPSHHHQGQLPWGDLNKSGSSIGDFTTRDHGLLTGILPDQHHAKLHSIIDPAHHSVIGSQYNVVGLTASNVLGILGSSSNPGSTQKIVHTDSLGGIILGSGLFVVSPSTSKVTMDGTMFVYDGVANLLTMGAKAIFNDDVTINDPLIVNDNATFNTGVVRFNTTPQINADLNFITADRKITSAAGVDLTIDLGADLIIPPDQTFRSFDFGDGIPIAGFSLFQNSGLDRQLTINTIKSDSLHTRLFVADGVRIDMGEEYWGKSLGIVHADFFVPATIGGTVSVYFEDSAVISSGDVSGHPSTGAALFEAGDWLLFRYIDWGAGLDYGSVWGTVSGYHDMGVDPVTGIKSQRWTFTFKHGDAGVLIKKGNIGVDFGVAGQGYVHLSTLQDADGPWIKIGTWSGTDPFTPGNNQNRTQIGNLQGISDINLNPFGYGLYSENAFLKGILRTVETVMDDDGLSILYPLITTAYSPDLHSLLAWRVNVDDRITRPSAMVSAYQQALGGITSDILSINNRQSDSSDYATIDISSIKTHGGGGTGSSIFINTEGIAFTPQYPASTVTVHGHIIPGETDDITYDLGSAAIRWRNLYVDHLYVTGAISGSSIGGQTWTYPGSMIIDPHGAGDLTLSIVNQGDGRADLVVDRDIILGGNIDGVDLSAHVSNPSAHHALATAGTGIIVAAGQIISINSAVVVTTPSTVVRTNRQIVTNAPLTGGGDLSGDLTLRLLLGSVDPGLTAVGGTLAVLLATSSGLSLTGGLQIASSIAGSGLSITAGKVLSVNPALFVPTTTSINPVAPLAGGGPLSGSVSLSLTLASHSGLDATAGLAIADSVAGPGLLIDSNKIIRVDTGYVVPVGRTVTAGQGLTGGGDLSANITLNVVALAGGGLQANADSMQIFLASASALNTTAGLAIDDSIAGAGLLISPTKVLSVNSALFVPSSRSIIAGLGLTGTHDLTTDVTINMANADGTLVLAADDAKVNQGYAYGWSALHTFGAGATFNVGVFQFNTNPKINANLDFIGTERNITSTASTNLNILPGGDLVLNPGGLDVFPGGSGIINLGGYNRKWSTLYAAELYVETLVASNVMATIGGRVMIAGTSSLIADFPIGATTIDLKHNTFASGTWLYLETIVGTTPQIEAIKTTTGPTTITGGYRYSVSRGTGGNFTTGGPKNWIIGDAVVTLGTAVGDGYIDQASVQTIHSKIGPTMTIYSRTATTKWNDIAPVVSMGNLNGFAGIGTTLYGFAAGNDLTKSPSTGFSGLAATSSGMAMYNTDIHLYQGATEKVWLGSARGLRMLTETAANRAVYWTDSFSDDVATAPNSFIYGYKSGTFRNLILGTIGATSELAGVTLTAQANGPFGGLYLYQGSLEVMFQPGSSLLGFYPSGRMLVSSDTAISPQAVIHAYEATSALDSGTGILIENGGSAGDAKLQLYLSAATSQNWVIGIDRSNGRSLSIAPGTDLGAALGITISPAGLVGIGASVPGSLLDVRGAGSVQSTLGTTTDTAASVASFIAATNGSDVLLYNRVSDTLATATRYGVSTGGAAEIIGSGAGLTSLMIGTNNLNVPIVFGQASAERMRIDTGGLVGIGTANPGTNLHLWVNQNVATVFQIQNDSTGTAAASGITLQVSGGSYGQLIKRSITLTTVTGIIGPGDLYIYNTSADIAIRNNNASGLIKMAVGSGTTPDLFIDNTHNIGFGIPTTEMEAWNTSYRAIEGFRAAIMFHNVTSGGLFMIDNMYYDGAWKLKSAAAASYMSLGGGTLSYGTAASGAIDLDVQTPGLLTTKFVVANSGNVGILNTSPGTYLQIGAADPTVTAYPGLWIVPGTTIAGIELQNSAGGHITLFAHSNGNNYIGSASNTPLILRTNNLDRMTIAAAGAVSVAGAASIGGTLDVTGLVSVSAGINFGDQTMTSYKEGTWTPILRFGGATTGISYSSRSGNYIAIGRMVFCYGSILLSSKGTATGSADITGLPFSVTVAYPGTLVWNNTAVSFVSTVIQPSTTSSNASFYGITAAALSVFAPLTNASFANNTSIQFSFCYST